MKLLAILRKLNRKKKKKRTRFFFFFFQFRKLVGTPDILPLKDEEYNL